MATHRIPILSWNTLPDTTGRAFFEPYTNKATNDIFNHLVLTLNDPGASQNHGVYSAFDIPVNYVTSPVIRVYWSSTVITGTCLFAFDYRAIGGDDTESLDQATFQEQVDISDVAASATDERLNVTGALTAGNFAAGDLVEFFFYRDGTTGAPTDTLAAAVTVHGLYFEYSDV